jgi:heme A synthase
MASARGHDAFRTVTAVAAFLCYVTILFGGTVMARGDGLACPHWPTCYANLGALPSASSAASVEWAHRVSAFVLSLGIAALALLGVAFERSRPVLLKLSVFALGLVVVEALLGGAVVESRLTLVLILVHLGVATALFGLLLMLVLLANLREIPRRWVAWAWHAAEEAPLPEPSLSPEPAPSVPSVPAPGPG